MPSCANLTAESRFMGLFIGPSGSGKTVAECSFPGPIKVFDFDGRIRGILGVSWLKKEEIEYTYYPPRIGANAKPSYIQINDDLEALMVSVNSGKCPYRTIILDSLTSQTFAMLCDAVTLTHVGSSGGKKIGVLNMAGPQDFGFEATATYNIMSFLRSLPVNIIVSAHVVDRYGKADPSDKYSESIVVGEKLSVRDKIGENIKIYFDNVFKFDKDMSGNKERFTVEFRGDLARTSFSELPTGKIDITGKNFYNDILMQALKK